MIARRHFLLGESALGTSAPAIVRSTSLMPILGILLRGEPQHFGWIERLYVGQRSPRQNGHMERLIGTVRRECLDQMVIFDETHLRRVLASYAVYYNKAHTALALQKDALLHRSVQRSGAIVAIPILAGLNHQYVRI